MPRLTICAVRAYVAVATSRELTVSRRPCGSCFLLSPLLARSGPALRSRTEGNIEMTTGTVKFFNESKGYGFIAPDEGGNDAFVHISAVERAGMRTLREGNRLSYDLEENRGKMS